MPRPDHAIPKQLRSHSLVAIAVCLSLGFVPRALATTLITFDVPAATNTIGTAINDLGTVAGIYSDHNNVYHGFIRNLDGTFVNADPPGATNINVTAINNAGTIIGWYNNASVGFMRDATGNYTDIVPSGATRVQPFGINASGVITGSYVDSGNITDGFVRDLDGTITTFEVESDTYPRAITNDGRIAGYYVYGIGYRSFVRSPLGDFTTFAAPAAYYGTAAIAMSDQGQVAGQTQEISTVLTAFLRNADGTLIEFSAPGAGKRTATGTTAIAINDSGTVAGVVISGIYTYSCFLRDAAGNFTEFTAPGAALGLSTYLRGLNNNGATTGEWTDSRHAQHGFVRF